MAHFILVSAHYPPFVGGIPRFVEHLANQLVSEGEEVTVLTSELPNKRPPGWSTTETGVQVLALPTRMLMGGRLPLLKKNRTYKRLLKELVAKGADYVMVNARFYPISLTGLKVAKKLNIPSVVLDHGSAPLTLNQKLEDWVLNKYEQHMTRACASYNPHFAGISKASLKLLEQFGVIASSEIPNAIDLPEFQGYTCDRDFSKEVKVPKGLVLAAHISRLEPEKGTDLLLQAARRAPHIHFVFAGSGSLLEEVKQANEELENVHYVGVLKPEEVSALFSICDALLLPSRSEGGPTIALEAAAQGVPTHAPSVGNIDEMLPNAKWLHHIERNTTSIVKSLSGLTKLSARERRALQRHIENNWSWKRTSSALKAALAKDVAGPSPETYDQTILPRVQTELSNLLATFDKTCKKLKLTYWIDGGTLLGAVRHSGFIPWDDDIDVGMTLKDWRTFIERAPEVLPKGYKLLTQENTAGFSAYWACLVKEDTRFIDADHFLANAEQGIYIDVFCFVPLDRRPSKATLQRLRLRFWQGVSYLKEIPYPHHLLHRIARHISRETITRNFWVAAHAKHPGHELINPSYADYAPIDSDIILPTKRIYFGELQVEGPQDPVAYLELEYGAWQKIPPKEKRHTHTPLILDFGDGVNVMGDTHKFV